MWVAILSHFQVKELFRFRGSRFSDTSQRTQLSHPVFGSDCLCHVCCRGPAELVYSVETSCFASCSFWGRSTSLETSFGTGGFRKGQSAAIQDAHRDMRLLVSGVSSPIATTYFKMDGGIASRTKGRQGSVCLKNAAPWSGGSVWCPRSPIL